MSILIFLTDIWGWSIEQNSWGSSSIPRSYINGLLRLVGFHNDLISTHLCDNLASYRTECTGINTYFPSKLMTVGVLSMVLIRR